jgi:hypothetical protein
MRIKSDALDPAAICTVGAATPGGLRVTAHHAPSHWYDETLFAVAESIL